MAKASQEQQALVVDGVEYFWENRHGWIYEAGVGLRGTSIAVCLQSAHTRELIVDFPFSLFGTKTPKKAVLLRHLAAAIRAALAAGWEAESRGKPYRFNAGDAA